MYNKENVNSFGSLYVLLGNNESEMNQFHTGGGSFCTRLFKELSSLDEMKKV